MLNDYKSAYLLNFLFISLFKRENFVRALFGVINFLPCLHFFLLEQGDSVREELSVSLNAIKGKGISTEPSSCLGLILTLCGAF